jgi:small subunit ribosomal protein S16
MVRIRLRRIGRKKVPIYQLVAADARARRDGAFLEDLGRYEPKKKPHTISIKEDRVAYWLSVGAQPTATARSILRQSGLLLKLHLRRKGKSEEEIAAEMEKWLKQRDERLMRNLQKKALRRKKKKEAEAKAKEGAAS